MRRLNMLQAGVAAALVTLSGAAASAQELVRIGLAVPHNAAYVQFYAAETLGFYKEAGVKAELTLYRGGAASQEALSAGAADIITYFGAGVALAISKGAKEKIVAAIDPTPHGWQFLVLANSPIKSIKDLDGKKIGVATKAGTADMFALWVADKAGAKVQTIPVGGGGMVPALRAGQVDAIAMFPAARAGIQHINHQVETADDVMRSFRFLDERQIPIVFGPGRHPSSSAKFLYFEGPDGMVFEYSSGVKMIADELLYRERQLTFEPTGFCEWGAKPNIPEFRK
jgi:ABC-type nitrate/sulfonate/bicarbonate transport system substrate-binding protein